MTKRDRRAKPPRVGFRRRINPYYDGMNKRQIAEDVTKTAFRWLVCAVLAYVYWLAMLLILSVFMLNVWHVSFTQILIYAGVLAAVTAVIYGYVLIHRKLFY